ncbi:hypothetical protein HNY73_000412 [Argiope bruennichi]|uniref:Uncharacterized protein n=1 Tax=Argiope bruennichi TaxID=94029 RepID=A0A8T0FY15_ARGBR|nr:hypothetical protein HNY73_000412 [Argiope bruennichi]
MGTAGLRQRRQGGPTRAPHCHFQGTTKYLGPHLQQKGPSPPTSSFAQKQKQAGEEQPSPKQPEVQWRRWGPPGQGAPGLGPLRQKGL